MPSLKVKKPSAEQLAKFAATIRAHRGTMSAAPALRAHKAVEGWLISRGDYLPPELAALGLACERSGRGYRYTCTVGPVTNSANTPGLKRAGKKALEERDWEWFAKQVSIIRWLDAMQRIKDAGVLSYIDFLTPIKAGDPDLFRAIVWHPNKLPPLFADHGISFDRNAQDYVCL